MPYFKFDLQLFGGSKSSTTVTDREPTEYELKLQEMQARYAEAIAPNAHELNNMAKKLLVGSLGTVQVDFNALNNNSQVQIGDALKGMFDTISTSIDSFGTYSKAIEYYLGDIDTPANSHNASIESLSDRNERATDSANDRLGEISGEYEPLANEANETLGDTAERFKTVADSGNQKIDPLGQSGIDAADDANGKLSVLSNSTKENIDKYAAVRENLIHGILPESYEENMADAIRTSVENTLGAGVNSLAARGVMDSSIAHGVMNDISRNASDTTSQNFLNNIRTINELIANQDSKELGMLSASAGIYDAQYRNKADALGRAFTIYNAETGNSNNALSQQAGIAQQKLGNSNNVLGQNASIEQQMFANTITGTEKNAALYAQKLAASMNAINSKANLANQWLQGVLGTEAQIAATCNGILGNTSRAIATAAAAQEAAQSPALSLWQTSLGLNASNAGALAAAAGSGKTTSTMTTSGGGFLSGLLGGLF